MFGLTADSPVPVGLWLGNSVLVTVVVTAGRVFFDSLAGYALSRLHFRGRGFLFATVLAVMSVPGVALLVPKFLIVTYLGIYDTYTAMILPLIVDAAGVFIMKQFFDSVPISIEEAARMDGASVFRTFWSVVLPMARPALITLTILSFQGSWNEFSHFLVTTQSPEKRTLVTGLASLTSGELWRGHPVPPEAGRCVPHDDPCRVAVLRLPAALRPGRQRRRREGLNVQPPDRRPPAPLTAVRLRGHSLGQQGTDGGDVGDGTARGEQACPLSPAASASSPR